MFRKLFAAAVLAVACGHAFAAVDVNAANEDALRGIKGIGPARAQAIVAERNAHGPFKDATDLARRVKGMGGHTVERLQGEGLAIGAAGPAATAKGAATAAATKAPPAAATQPRSSATAKP